MEGQSAQPVAISTAWGVAATVASSPQMETRSRVCRLEVSEGEVPGEVSLAAARRQVSRAVVAPEGAPSLGLRR